MQVVFIVMGLPRPAPATDGEAGGQEVAKQDFPPKYEDVAETEKPPKYDEATMTPQWSISFRTNRAQTNKNSILMCM